MQSPYRVRTHTVTYRSKTSSVMLKTSPVMLGWKPPGTAARRLSAALSQTDGTAARRRMSSGPMHHHVSQIDGTAAPGLTMHLRPAARLIAPRKRPHELGLLQVRDKQRPPLLLIEWHLDEGSGLSGDALRIRIHATRY